MTDCISEILDKSYAWNSGFIRFDMDNVLTTKWGKGTYNCIDAYTINATWNSFMHILTMNSSYTAYTAIRSNDKEITKGTIILPNTATYSTKYGFISLYNNELFIGDSFKQNKYWDEDTLLKLKEYINPNKNILEIGGHCGTSTVVYASFLNPGSKCFVYEPQKNMHKLLVQNIKQNNLEDKISAFNKGVFCFNGKGAMNDVTLDGGHSIVAKRYNEEKNLACNFGGLCLGADGESIDLTTVDSMNHDNIGYIHCDAQGSENFIFSSSLLLINKCKPVILYENNELHGQYLYNNVCAKYPEYKRQSKFNIKEYCMKVLGYSKCIERFNGSIDYLLLP